MFVMRVARKDLASKSIPRYDDAKDKLGAIVTAPTLFQMLAQALLRRCAGIREACREKAELDIRIGDKRTFGRRLPEATLTFRRLSIHVLLRGFCHLPGG
jgi:hypothetical protein